MTMLLWVLDAECVFNSAPTDELVKGLIRLFFDGEYKLALPWFWEISGWLPEDA